MTRTILAIILLIVPFSTAYPASIDKTEPIAQVYDVQGKATIKSFVDGNILEVQKGSLLGLDDSLTLDKNASIAVYFKNGARKEIRAKDTQASYKVADLLPKAEAYSQSAPVFGATRGIDNLQTASHLSGFFYPQEAVILDSPPLMEFILFHGSSEIVALGGATVQIVKDSAVVDSSKFNSLEYGSPYVYQPGKLDGLTEYKVVLRLELEKVPGNIAISFPLYISGIPDFSDPVYRSFESASIDHKGKKRTITALKQLAIRGASPQTVIVIELFIP